MFATQSHLLRLKLAIGTTIAAEIGQAVADLKLEVKWELVLQYFLSLPWQGSNS